ncbi:alpha/beta hydrolase [Roseivirga sp. BDSF3-8]|uniref:alpha/beta hydrolase n=1 Tax=Roseivirga sp. BDSF3-8 TaxID=3241598 RepID=UPI0035324996
MSLLKKLLKWSGLLIGVLLIIFIAFLIIPEPVDVLPITPRESTRYWDMKEGFRLAYTHLPGDPAGAAPIVFLHGGPGGYVHSSIIETMAEISTLGHDVYLYDQRGSGLSDRMPRYSDISFDKHLQDLHEVITEKIGARQVILMGQSFGSILIAHYSARYPDHVAGLIFSSPGTLLPHRRVKGQYADLDSLYPAPDTLQFRNPYDFVDDVNLTAAKPKAIVATLGALLLDKKLISDEQMDQVLNNLAAKFTRGMVCDPANVLPEEGGGGLYAYLATNQVNQPEIRRALQNVQAPALILQGQCEHIPFSAAYEYAALYPRSRYEMIENAGHEIWWEEPDKYIGLIREFLTQHRPGTAGGAPGKD